MCSQTRNKLLGILLILELAIKVLKMKILSRFQKRKATSNENSPP